MSETVRDGRLAGKAAVVTGAASGFGRGIAQCFAREGASVLVADRNAEGAEKVAEHIRKQGGIAQAHTVDVTDGDGVLSMYTASESAFKAFHILVANAGLGQRPGRLEETSEEVFDALFDVNVKGVYHCCRHAIPLFRGQGHGTIIITASGIALKPRANFVAYGASKTAVVGLAKGLAEELAPDGIRVNAILPGLVEGERQDRVISARAEALGKSYEEVEKSVLEKVSLRRMVSQRDIANMVLFLCSPAGRNVSGQSLSVCGNVETL